jgi:hypothetical protein
MRTECRVTVLSFAVLLGACSKPQEKTAGLPDDLKKDLAAASQSTGDLTTAPATYKRMRFVSSIEQSRATVVAKRPKVSRNPDRMTVSHHASSEAADVAADPIASLASHAPQPISTPATQVSDAPVAVAVTPAAEPAHTPAGITSTGTEHSGGLGGLLGGIFGGAVIRGGAAGPDKCDPRTDGRQGGIITDRPTFGMPSPTGGGVFGGGRHR